MPVPARLRRRRPAAVVLVALCATLLAAALAAPALAADPSPSPSGSPEPTVVTCTLSQASVVFGGSVVVSGTVTPAAEGLEVAIALDGLDVATTTTDATGAFSVPVTAPHSGAVTARLVADGTTSDPVALAVKPAVTLSHGSVIPFLAMTFTVRVKPAAYDGLVTVQLVHHDVVIATVKGRVKDGKVTLRLPLRGIGLFGIRVRLESAQGLAARTVNTSVTAAWKRLAAGSSGLRVKGMLTAFNRLHIKVPGIGTTFTTKVKDAVVAFQKAYRLPRTYVMDGDDWRKLDAAKTVTPRATTPSTHLEVDKTRQILMVVKDGKVYGLIAVSTGATGNTPEGAFRIRHKSLYAPSLYGGLLFRSMGFIGNYAIHGYPSVPPYPASHGCIREPMWVADWVFDQSFVGERLYVYH